MAQGIAVLFDLDGTLVNTEPYWFKAMQQICMGSGYCWTETDSEETMGANLDTTVQVLKDRAGIPKTVAEIRKELIIGVESCYQQEGVPWLEGAYQLLEALSSAAIPTAVVSNSPSILVQRVVELAPKGALSLMVAGDIPNLVAKPAPDPYLYAAQKLGVKIQHCLVFEDSATGITAAIRSGAKAVLLGDSIRIEKLASDVQENLNNPTQACRSRGLGEWNPERICEFLG